MGKRRTMMIKPGIELMSETLGDGPPVQRLKHYQIKLRMWLRQGEPVRWPKPWGILKHARVEEDGAAMTTDVRLDRVYVFAGLFYGIQGMRVGGIRTLRIAPHLAYGKEGVPDVIPPNALLTVEVGVLSERTELDW